MSHCWGPVCQVLQFVVKRWNGRELGTRMILHRGICTSPLPVHFATIPYAILSVDDDISGLRIVSQVQATWMRVMNVFAGCLCRRANGPLTPPRM